ncbi:hypothetical protein [Thermoactinospora rubra]|uniref:hypothetical protein n=1 Tax=Thermoactinospora rubra TaxID=1088767 RepID=UPI000A1052BC|nr:hypothetical protein [Thermoactinospora rubra]
MREKPVTGRDQGVTAALLAALGEQPPPPFRVRAFRPLGALGPGVEREFSVDQTNHSVVVDERFVVKWITPPAPVPHPAPELLGHLAAVGFAETAPPYAAVFLREGGREFLVALVTGFLPGARDGWEWCVEEAVAGRVEFAAAVGGLAAGLHRALASFPGTAPGTAQPGLDAASRAEAALREALELTGKDDEEDGAWLATRAGAMRRELARLRDPAGSPAIRIHGDLHVGQILRWEGGYAVVDFDGNPTIPDAAPYQPAARDVAQLTTSLEHVAQVAVKRRGLEPGRAREWAAEARERLLAAYRARARDLLDETLLRPFEVEQECRELIYAARHLPRWRYAPMGVLRTWYPEENP